MWRTELFEKNLILGKIEGKRRSGWQRMRCLNGITDSMDMSLSKLKEIVKDGEAWQAVVHGVSKSWTEWLNNNTIFHGEEPGPCTVALPLFLNYSFLIYAFPPYPASDYLNLPFGTPGRSRRLNAACFLQTRNGGHRKDSYPGEIHRLFAPFNRWLSNVLNTVL